MLELKEVKKQFGDFTAVDNHNFSVAPGEILGLIGANGAGKTTTFRMILGLLEPTIGTIRWNQKRITYETSNQIGYLPEERGLYPKLTVKKQLIYIGLLRGMKRDEVLEQIEFWLNRFKITGHLDKKAGDLSKGNQQKIQFIMAVLHRPKLLILDEPFTGLDPVNVELLKQAIVDLKNEGTTILFSSHRMEHVEEICEKLCLLKEGKVIAYGTLDAIKKEYEKNTIFIKGELTLEALQNIQGVDEVEQTTKGYRLTAHSLTDVQSIIQAVVRLGAIQRIEQEEATLNEIFIDKVGGTDA